MLIALLVTGLLWSTPAAAGTISGAVSLNVGDKKKKPVRYHRGPYRSTRTGHGPRNPLRDVVVYVEGIESSARPGARAEIRQIEDRFVPHVLPVVAGTSVSFPNDDDYYHNVFSVVAGERFDLGRYARGHSATQIFTQPALVVVRCEIHPGMRAFVLVLANSHFTQPDDGGRYQLDDLPAGTVTVRAWHPAKGLRSGEVIVPATGSALLDFAF